MHVLFWDKDFESLCISNGPSICPFVCSYRYGIRGHMKNVVQEMLRSYLKIETQFQLGVFLSTLIFQFIIQVILSVSC